MNQRNISLASLCVLTGAFALGCNNMPWSKHDNSDMKSSSDKTMMSMKTAVATVHSSGAATTQPMNNNVAGTVTFTQTSDGVKVAINLTGLEPNSTHGFHIHEKGVLSDPALMSAGGHFNPEGHKHGGPQSAMAHAGDLGNITADAHGNVNTEMTVRGLMLDNSKMGILGRSVIVHAKADDLTTDPSGNSGARVAGGVIQGK